MNLESRDSLVFAKLMSVCVCVCVGGWVGGVHTHLSV